MTKRYKKQERLSPQTKKLIERANKIYLYDPEKAIEYLLSVEPHKLSSYDRRKVGKEILFKLGQTDQWFKDEEGFKAKYGVITSYDLDRAAKKENQSRKFGYKQSLLRSSNKDILEAQQRVAKGNYDNDPPVPRQIWAENMITGGGRLVPDGYYPSSGNPLEIFMSAGRKYEEIGLFDKAQMSYQEALKIFELTPKKVRADYSKEKIEKDLVRVKEEKEKLDIRKHKVGMHTSNLISRISSIIAVSGILGSLFFLGSDLTGNVIADLTTQTTSFIGASLLIIGLIASFFWIKSKR